MDLQVLRICRAQRLDMGLKRVSWVWRYQGQCRALRPLGHQGYRLRNYKKDPPLCSGYKGETGFVAILGKTAKIHPKVVTRKIVSPYHKKNEPRAFAWMQTEALLPFCNKGWGSKLNGSIFQHPKSLKHTIYGKRGIYRRYWHVHIFGSLRNKNMSKHFWSRPIVGAFKYAHYG